MTVVPHAEAPDIAACREYLGVSGVEWTDDQIAGALYAEMAAQARTCKVPADGELWPTDLAEALMRRTARNLSARSLPLGIQSTVSEMAAAQMRLGWDFDIARLEAPYRKRVVG